MISCSTKINVILLPIKWFTNKGIQNFRKVRFIEYALIYSYYKLGYNFVGRNSWKFLINSWFAICKTLYIKLKENNGTSVLIVLFNFFNFSYIAFLLPLSYGRISHEEPQKRINAFSANFPRRGVTYFPCLFF